MLTCRAWTEREAQDTALDSYKYSNYLGLGCPRVSAAEGRFPPGYGKDTAAVGVAGASPAAAFAQAKIP